MRYGLISDIHGNLHALEAALAALRREGVDALLCAGDLVGYGPLPNECVELVADLGCVTVAGNHDLIALGTLSDERCIPLARNSLRWTRERLRDDVRRYLAALPLRVGVGEHVVLAHGSLDDPQEYVVRPEQAAAQLQLVAERYPGTRALVLGHTHRQRAHGPGGGELPAAAVRLHPGRAILLNPGSVGQSRERAARCCYAVLDLEAGTARFHSTPYDTAACRSALRLMGLPAHSCHLAPSRLRSALGKVRRFIRLGSRMAHPRSNEVASRS